MSLVRTWMVLSACFLTQGLSQSPAEEKSDTERESKRSDRYGDSLPEGAVARLGTVRLRHLEAAYSVAISPMHRSHWNSAPRTWDAATGKPLLKFEGKHQHSACASFSPCGKFLASGSWDQTILLWDLTAPPGGSKQARDFETLWRELASDDAKAAYNAMCELVRRPETAVPGLRERVKPVARVDAAAVARLLRDLDHEQFAIRDKSELELARFGELIEPALKEAVARPPSAEVRRRAERLLEGIHQQRRSPDGERLRVGRAVEVLERIGNPDARKLLQTLAEGAPEAKLTVEAKASVERLNRQP